MLYLEKESWEQEKGKKVDLTLPLMIEVLGKGFKRAGRRYNNMDQMDKSF